MNYNAHNRPMLYKRQRYWVCKRLHINIYENKKVCTNWVRRILMTEVAYDIIKVFRNSNEAFRNAKLEAYIQWSMRKSAKKLIVLNYFKSKVSNNLSFKSRSNDAYIGSQKKWIDVNKYKLYKNNRVSNSSLLSGRGYISSLSSLSGMCILPYRSRLFFKSIFCKFVISRRLSVLGSRYNSFSEYWFRGIYPEVNTFRVRSFSPGTAKWFMGSAISSRTHSYMYGNLYGKLRGYKNSIFSSGSRQTALHYKLLLLEYKIRSRIYFRFNIIRVLMDILHGVHGIDKIYNIVKSLNSYQFLNNRSILNIIFCLLNNFNKARLLFVIKLFRRYNKYDYSHLMLYSKYSRCGVVSSNYIFSSRQNVLNEYRKFYCISNTLSWYSTCVYPNASKGASDIVRNLSNSYQCVVSGTRYEDFDIVFNTNLYNLCFPGVVSTYSSLYICFLKWYYLYLVRDKYMVYHISNFSINDKRRRLLLRNLYILRGSTDYSVDNFLNLVRYMCEGFIVGLDTIHSINTAAYSSSSFLKVRSSYISSMFTYRVSNVSVVYNSYTKVRKYLTEVVDYGPSFKTIYMKYFVLYFELRSRFIHHTILSCTNYYKQDDILLFDDYYYTKYNIYNNISSLYYSRNSYDNDCSSFMYYSGSLYNYSLLKYNYVILYSFVNMDSLKFEGTFTESVYTNIGRIHNYLKSSYDTGNNIFFSERYSYSNYRNFGFIFFQKFFRYLSTSGSITCILNHVLDVDKFDVLKRGGHIGMETYFFDDGKYDLMHYRGFRGSYVSRPWTYRGKFMLEIPSTNTVYYVIMNMLFHLFLFRFQDRYNNHSSLLNWFTFIHFIYLRLSAFNEYIDEYILDLGDSRLKKHVDDDLFYSFSTYKFLGGNIKNWGDFRKVPLYSKYEEYFFCIDNESRKSLEKLHLKRYRGNNYSYMYGYTGKYSKLFKSYDALSRSTKFMVTVKNLHNKRLRFRGYGSYDTLLYWCEVGESVVDIDDHDKNVWFYNYLISGLLLRDSRYVEESRFYYKMYNAHSSYLYDYLKDVRLGSSKYNFKLKNYMREHDDKFVKRFNIVEDMLRDSRDFFNPYLDYGVLLVDNNFVRTKLWQSYSDVYGTFITTSESPQMDVCYNSLNSIISSNLFLWNDNSRFIASTDSTPYISNNSARFTINKRRSYFSHGNILLNMLDSLGSKYSSMDLYILILTSKTNIHGTSHLNIFYKLRDSFVKSTSFIIKYNNISSSITSRAIDIGVDSRYIGDFINHLSICSVDFVESSSWYILLVKSAIVCSYRSYLKVYGGLLVSCWLLRNYTGRFDLGSYSWYYRNYLKLIFTSSSGDSSSVLMKYNIYTSFLQFHVGHILSLNRWLIYWSTFFSSTTSNYASVVNYKLLGRYLLYLNYSCSNFRAVDSDFIVRDFGTKKLIKSKVSILNMLGACYVYRYSANIKKKYKNYIFVPIHNFSLDFSNYIVYRFIHILQSIYVGLRLIFGLDIMQNALLVISIIYRYIDRVRFWLSLYRDYINSTQLKNTSDHKFSLTNYSNCILNTKNMYMFIKNIRRLKNRTSYVNRCTSVYTLSFKKFKVGKYLRIYKKTKSRSLSTIFRHFTYYFYNYISIDTSISHAYNIYMSYKIYMLGLHVYITYAKWSYNIYSPSYSVHGGLYSNSKSGIFDYIHINYIYDSQSLTSYTFRFSFSASSYMAMFEFAPIDVEVDNLQTWFIYHYMVRVDTRRYYSKFWYRYLPEDIVHIQRYRRFQQELRRLIANRKCLRSGIIYRRLLLFKLVPGISKEWHRLHVRRPYIREQFEDRVRFFYILKYKYKISRKRLLSSLYNRFSSPYTLYRSYHLIYFRLDNILYKLSFVPSFTYLRDNWATQFWNISINCIHDISYIQRSLMVGDMFFIKSGLHISAVSYRLSSHFDNNFYLVYLLWLRLYGRVGLGTSSNLPSEQVHAYIGKVYLWYWYRIFHYLIFEKPIFIYDVRYFKPKLKYYGFWAHNFIRYKEFKNYMLISSLDHSVRWFSKSMCGFVYKEPVGFLGGLHYSAYYNKESGSYGGHLRFSSAYK